MPNQSETNVTKYKYEQTLPPRTSQDMQKGLR